MGRGRKREGERNDNILAGINLRNGPRLSSVCGKGQTFIICSSGGKLATLWQFNYGKLWHTNWNLKQTFVQPQSAVLLLRLGRGGRKEQGNCGAETARSSCWSDNVCSAAAIGNKPRPICTRTMNPCGALCHIKRKCTRRRGQAAAAQAAVQEQQQQWQHHRPRCCCHFCWRLATLSTAVAAADVVTASCCM